MSTRSVIAKPTEDGWIGRYVHYDGYPEAMVPEYLRLVNEKGVDRCIDILINFNAGWSSIEQNPVLSVWYDDGRFKAVSNYGVAYTTKVIPNFAGQANYQQASMDHWISDKDGDTWCEWAYVLYPEFLQVWENCGNWKIHSNILYSSPVYFDSEGALRNVDR